jgi:hypothetical protein
MIFIDNKYTRTYNQLVAKRQQTPATGYIEKHHIIPRSMGGSNNPTNLVAFTAREHYIAHLLLTKMTTGPERSKMFKAALMMANRKVSKVNSRIYETLRKEHSKEQSARMKAHYASPENRKKHRERALAQGLKPPTTPKGFKQSPEQVEKMRQARWGKKAQSNE